MTCNPENFPKLDTELITDCNANVEIFETEAQKCFDMSQDEACDCWKTLSAIDLKDCKII